MAPVIYHPSPPVKAPNKNGAPISRVMKVIKENASTQCSQVLVEVWVGAGRLARAPVSIFEKSFFLLSCFLCLFFFFFFIGLPSITEDGVGVLEGSTK